jgi:hypothetical protein
VKRAAVALPHVRVERGGRQYQAAARFMAKIQYYQRRLGRQRGIFVQARTCHVTVRAYATFSGIKLTGRYSP